jgi:PilZ domain
MSERRRARRTQGTGFSARVRPGHRVRIVDVSAGGALLEAARPLRPGSHVEVQFERAHARVRMAGRVVRCGVTAIDPEAGLTYRAGVAFNETFEWAREDATLDGYEMPEMPHPHKGSESRTHK